MRTILIAALPVAGFAAPAYAQQSPTEYACQISALGGPTQALAMRFGPGHVSAKFTADWSPNACTDGKTKCTIDANGRYRVSGSGTEVSMGDISFDPASGAFSMKLAMGGQTINADGTCAPAKRS